MLIKFVLFFGFVMVVVSIFEKIQTHTQFVLIWQWSVENMIKCLLIKLTTTVFVPFLVGGGGMLLVVISSMTTELCPPHNVFVLIFFGRCQFKSKKRNYAHHTLSLYQSQENTDHYHDKSEKQYKLQWVGSGTRLAKFSSSILDCRTLVVFRGNIR